MNPEISFNKYLPIVLIYCFFNSWLLPNGLLYTNILSIPLLIWLSKYPSFRHIWWFFPPAIAFSIIHLINGVDLFNYFRSMALLFTVYVFILSFHQFLINCKTLREIYMKAVLFNFAFTCFAVITLPISPIADVLWYANELTYKYDMFRRLRLLAPESALYSMVLVPFAMYYYLKLLFLKLPQPILTCSLITIPLMMSMSFGVIACIVIAIGFIILWGTRTLSKRYKMQYFYGALLLMLAAGILFIFLFPENSVVIRLKEVVTGRDTSFNGRTTDSFYLAWKIAELKSSWFGGGAGQSRLLGLDLFKEYYNNPNYPLELVGFPNAVADTLAAFGIVGVVIRFGLQFYFIFATKVYTNYYRFGLFIFIFVYQFTGSYITNLPEYVIWGLAFHKGLFNEFESTVHSKSNPVERQGRRLSGG